MGLAGKEARMIRVVFAAVLVASAGCATSQSRGKPAPLDAPGPAKVDTVAAPAPAKPPKHALLTCSAAGRNAGGLYVSPGDKAGFGTAPPDDPQAPETSAALSKKDLRERICGDLPCNLIEAQLQLAHSGPLTSGHHCAMSLVPGSVVAAHFKAVSGSPLDEQLGAVVDALYAYLERTGAKGEVSIDKVVDHGHPGTPRSNYLKDRLTRTLYEKKQVLIASLPKGWSGKSLPRGMAAVLSATVVTPSKNARKIDVTWEALVAGPRKITRRLPLPLTTLAVDDLPAGTVAGSAEDRSHWPSDDSLKLRIDAAPGGSLCPGEKTQLTAWSQKRRHVQIFSLFGNGQAMLVYPSAEASGVLPARADVPIGGEGGFVAQPLEGDDEELFLVLGADSAAPFTDTASWKGPCMVPAAFAKKLWNPTTLSATLAKTTEGYQIARGTRCEGLPPVEPVTLEQLVSAFPTCQ